jgi:hypothetical protein
MRSICVVFALFAIPSVLIAAEPKWPSPSGTIEFPKGRVDSSTEVFADSTGGIWKLEGHSGFRGSAQRRLARWNGEAWDAAPPLDLPHMEWMRRPAPPWNAWHTPLFVIPGDKGSLLAVAIGDSHQQSSVQMKKLPPINPIGELKDPDILKALELHQKKAAELQAKREKDKTIARDRTGEHSTWWVGWLFDDNKWIGPLEMNELLKQKRATLNALFARGRTGPAVFDIVSDGKNLWAAFAGKVHVFTEKGTASWDLPIQGNLRARVLNLVSPEPGVVWCHYVHDNKSVATRLLEKDGAIDAKDFGAAAAPVKQQDVAAIPHFYSSAKGPVVLWGISPLRGNPNVHFWNAGESKWQPRDDIRHFLGEDASNDLWFLPSFETAQKENGYRIVSGKTTKIIAVPKRIRLGLLTDAGPGRKIGTAYDLEAKKQCIVEWHVSKDEKTGWEARRVRHTDAYGLDGHRVFVDAKGNFIHDNGIIAKAPQPTEKP